MRSPCLRTALSLPACKPTPAETVIPQLTVILSCLYTGHLLKIEYNVRQPMTSSVASERTPVNRRRRHT
jgi:hypothetical protein